MVKIKGLINRNMRCIETVPYGFDAPNIKSINRNMRCIETFKTVFQTAKAD